jgi:hypothetical protein
MIYLSQELNKELVRMEKDFTGQPFEHGSYKGLVTRKINEGSFKGLWEVKVCHEKDGNTCYWYFKPEYMQEKYTIK